MKEHPILFSDPMVRAILAGRKTQTRRLVTRGRSDANGQWERLDFARAWVDPGLGSGAYLKVPLLDLPGDPADDRIDRVRARVAIGDRLWVRECWAAISPHADPAPIEECTFEYRADAEPGALPGGWEEAPNDAEALRWRPSIHMPRRACRLVLEVTDVRVERLQSISAGDAQAEGAHGMRSKLTASTWRGHEPSWSMLTPHPVELDALKGYERCLGSPQMAFANLWNAINGVDAWDANPWVWAITFRRAA